MKVLFVLRNRIYNQQYADSYGLINSAQQVASYLETLGHSTKLVSVIDANFIDKEVHDFRPDLVIIEALWVPTDKLKNLIELKRYRHIHWVIRIHSDSGFLSAETNALKNVNEYIELKKKNLHLSANHEAFNSYLSKILHHHFTYLPNLVDTYTIFPEKTKDKSKYLDIGCFGALRIMKNQLFQAICAIEAADRMDLKLRFHVNGNVKDGENSVLKNLENLFKHSKHKLIIHNWLSHLEFEKLILRMDLGMQVSYSESFNIVSADFVNLGVPIITSEVILWVPEFYKTSIFDYDEVVEKIIKVYKHRHNKFMKLFASYKLEKYLKSAREKWKWFMKILVD